MTAELIEVTVYRQIVRKCYSKNGNVHNPTFKYCYVVPDREQYRTFAKAKDAVMAEIPNAKIVVRNSHSTNEWHAIFPHGTFPK